jgi:DNA polymerase-3 subunit epsilon
MDPVVVTDLETTGLSPEMGERANEIAEVSIRDGRIVDRYQCLMNAGRCIPNTSTGSATP